MRFLFHVTGANKLNFPFYLLKILEKMDVRAGNHSSSSGSNVFHHGLIKLLITQELGKLERSWSHFIFWEGFKVKFKDAEKIKRNKKSSKIKVLETSNSAETKNSSKNKIEYYHEQECLEEITSTQLPQEEPGLKRNDHSVLGSVDGIQSVREGPIHTKNISKVIEFSFKPFKTYSRPKN